MIKKIALIYGLLAIVLVALAGGAAWYFNKPTPVAIDDTIPPATTDCTDELDTRCWQTYRNEEYGFEFKFPAGWEIYKLSNTSYELMKANNTCYKECHFYVSVIRVKTNTVNDLYGMFNDSSRLWLEKFPHIVKNESWGDDIVFENIKESDDQPYLTARNLRSNNHSIGISASCFDLRDCKEFSSILKLYDFKNFLVY